MTMWTGILFVAVVPVSLYLLLRRSGELLIARGNRAIPVPADVGIVLGAYTDGYHPSPPLTKRLYVALQLYRQGLVRALIVSGGRGDDETVTESKSMKRFLIINGVPSNVIFEERASVDTWENIRNSSALMRQLGFQTAIIVTSDYHLPRALAVARRLHIDVSGCPAPSGSREKRFAMREVLARIQYTLQGKTPLV